MAAEASAGMLAEVHWLLEAALAATEAQRNDVLLGEAKWQETLTDEATRPLG